MHIIQQLTNGVVFPGTGVLSGEDALLELAELDAWEAKEGGFYEAGGAYDSDVTECSEPEPGFEGRSEGNWPNCAAFLSRLTASAPSCPPQTSLISLSSLEQVVSRPRDHSSQLAGPEETLLPQSGSHKGM